jgi:YcaO-like protein with predicted kinase domain
LKRFFEATHRSVCPEETLARLLPKLSSIGVTRVANITGLDYIGLPVVMSVRPVAKSLSVQQGKGLTIEAAKVSAIMESVESFSSQKSIANVAWRRFEACTGSSFIYPRRSLPLPLPPDTLIPWVHGRDMFTPREVLVPQELVTTDSSVTKPSGYGWFAASSNGLAAGNTLLEAQVHALCELIERDAYALWRLSTPELRSKGRIDAAALDDVAVTKAVELLHTAQIVFDIWDITSDIGVPCFFCVIDDRNGRAPYLGRFGGLGCHTSAGVAISRALTEAVQSRLTFIVGSREDLSPQSYSLIGSKCNIGSALFRDLDVNRSEPFQLPSISLDQPSIAQDLSTLLDCLLRRGITEAAVVDLTDREIQIPCVRVVVPDLEGMIESHAYRAGKRARRAGR